MLIPIEIDADSIAPPTPSYVTKTLQEVLLNYGVIAMSTDYLKNTFVPAIRAAPPEEREAWWEVIRACPRKVPADAPGPVVDIDPEEAAETVRGRDLLAIVDPSMLKRWARALGLDGDSDCLHASDPGLELAIPGAIPHTRHISKRRGWSNEHLTTGFDREEFWTTRLRPVFQASSFVTISDVNFIEIALRDGDNGAQWLLRKISTLRGAGATALNQLTIISGLPPAYSDSREEVQAMAARLMDLCGGQVAEVRFALGEQSRLRPQLHTRQIRFATEKVSRGMTFSDSVDIFSHHSTRPTVHFTYLRLSCEDARVVRDEEHKAMRIADAWGYLFTISG